MRDRGLVHFSHLTVLADWAKARGWKEEPVKDTYEVLRLRSGKQCAIFHKKHAAQEHLTVWGDSEKLARQFMRWHREQEATPLEANS
jgi:hypothetical protein